MSLVHVSIFCEFLLSQYTIFAMKRSLERKAELTAGR